MKIKNQQIKQNFGKIKRWDIDTTKKAWNLGKFKDLIKKTKGAWKNILRAKEGNLVERDRITGKFGSKSQN